MIITRKLGKSYPGEIQALTGLSVVVAQGEFVFLVGPNGAGKSTFLKLLTREEDPTEGCILMHGRSISELTRPELAQHRRNIGTVFQDARLVPSMTVRENVIFPLSAAGKAAEDVADSVDMALAAAEVIELADRFPDDLSGGQQQKVAIARSLVNEPQVILADEPTGNLSPAATDEIMRVFHSVNSGGITVLVATHNYDVVDEMSRRVIALEQGVVVSDAACGRYPTHLRKAAA